MPQTPNNIGWIQADWPVPGHIHAGTTTRTGGLSQNVYSSLNLADHVDDDPECVKKNRKLLREQLQLPCEPCWLQQVHGNNIINLSENPANQPADGAYTNRHNNICVILTADCLPLLICNRIGSEIAAVHIGWRGFSKNIIATALNTFSSRPADIVVWIGPSISAKHYEVGEEVRAACSKVVKNPGDAFIPSRPGHWFADIQKLVRFQLQSSGVNEIYGGKFCTYSGDDRFFSFRRDGITGRVASLIWMDSLKT